MHIHFAKEQFYKNFNAAVPSKIKNKLKTNYGWDSTKHDLLFGISTI